MDKKRIISTKEKVFMVGMQLLFNISLIAYGFSIYKNGYDSGVNIFTILATSTYVLSSFTFSKEKPQWDNKALTRWSLINGILFVTMMVFEIIQIIIYK